MEGGEKRCCRRPVTCPHHRRPIHPFRSAADGCDPPAARHPPLNGALASACERWLRGSLPAIAVRLPPPLGTTDLSAPRRRGGLAVTHAVACGCLVGAGVRVAAAVPARRESPGDARVWLRGPCPAVRARRTTRSHSPRVLSYAHGHVRL